ncbi:MAG: patatin-like phospholipase family protein [Candidatus Fermentibacteraceae bacterium]
MPGIGLALGGGGVRGLAHIRVLAEFDRAGIRPCALAGTSMGAIMGAMYASGMPAAEMEEHVREHVIMDDDRLSDILHKRRHLLKWAGAFIPEIRGRGLVHADRLLEMIMGEVLEGSFEDLEIPLTVVAADYWTGEQVLFDEGPLEPAVKASMSVPGVFPPVELEGRVLVDGGIVNQVPYDLLADSCQRVAAVDVGPAPRPGKSDLPGALDAIAGAFDIVQNRMLELKLERSGPDILVRPRFEDIGLMDFSKVDDVFEQSAGEVARLREYLQELPDRKGGPQQ